MPREIRAAVCAGGEPPVIESLLLDDPAADELVIAVGAAGVCHTDIGVAQWAQEPRVLGHEGAGTVVEVGEAVTKFSVGDRVVATFGSCGTCPTCNAGRPAYCVDGIALNIEGMRAANRPTHTRPDGTPIGGAFFQQSCFASHALVTERNVVKLPDDIDFVTAAPLGCGIQTGAGGVYNMLDAGEGEPIAVIGCGAVGLAGVMAARIKGCSVIVAVDIEPSRLELARELGATHTIDGRVDDLAGALREASGGLGLSAVLETAGLQATFDAAIHALRPGGQVGVVTAPGEFGQPIPHPGGTAFMTTSVIGILEGDSVPDVFLPQLMDWHRSGDLPYDRLIKTFAFDDIAEAFAASRDHTAIKPVLTFEGGGLR